MLSTKNQLGSYHHECQDTIRIKLNEEKQHSDEDRNEDDGLDEVLEDECGIRKTIADIMLQQKRELQHSFLCMLQGERNL